MRVLDPRLKAEGEALTMARPSRALARGVGRSAPL